VQSNEYDYIVIGAGGCGAVIASRLAGKCVMFCLLLLLRPSDSIRSNHPSTATEQGQSVLVLETGEDEHLNPLTRWGYFFPSVSFFLFFWLSRLPACLPT
jgi:hypothetical protein